MNLSTHFTRIADLPPIALLVLAILALGNGCLLASFAIIWWRGLPVGTKSVLIGAHCFWLHPWMVAIAWWKLYGFPVDPRLWVCFMIHDLGYWGLPNMDGVEGEKHVLWGAWAAHRWCDRYRPGHTFRGRHHPMYWHDLCLNHSRYWAKQHNRRPSRLCYADKLAFVITPAWIYKLCVRLTGEWREYAAAHNHEVHHDAVTLDGWYRPSREYVRQWVAEFSNGERTDTWTQPKPSATVV